MANIREQILSVLKKKEDRLNDYLHEEIISERQAIEDIGTGGAFDYHTLAKQYVESTLKQLLQGKEGKDLRNAFEKAIDSVVFGVKSTFVGNKKLNNKTLLDAAKKDPRVAKLLRLDSKMAQNVSKRLNKAGVSEVESVEFNMKGPVLTQRYAMFSDAVRALVKDQGWINGFKKTLVASSDKGAEMEGTKPFAPKGKDPNLKTKFSVDDKTEGDQGGIGKNLKEEAGSEGDGGEAYVPPKKSSVNTDDTKKKKSSCNTDMKKKKSSVDTDKKDLKKKKKLSVDADDEEKKAKKEKQDKAWNGVRQYKNFNY